MHTLHCCNQMGIRHRYIRENNGHIAIGYCHWQGSGNSQKNLNASPHSSTMAKETQTESKSARIAEKTVLNIVRTGTEASAGQGEKAKTGIQTRSKTKATGSQTKASRS